MISVKDQVAEFLTRVSSFRRNLDDVVEDDECMALMAVSKLKENPELYRYVPFASLSCVSSSIAPIDILFARRF
jgi:hypothetical protein